MSLSLQAAVEASKARHPSNLHRLPPRPLLEPRTLRRVVFEYELPTPGPHAQEGDRPRGYQIEARDVVFTILEWGTTRDLRLALRVRGPRVNIDGHPDHRMTRRDSWPTCSAEDPLVDRLAGEFKLANPGYAHLPVVVW